MLRLSNISIGVKLAIMSGMGVLLVAAMIVTQLVGNSLVRSSNENVVKRAGVAQNSLDAKASIRGMQIGVRDIRLARTSEDINKATAYMDERQRSATKYLDNAIQLAARAETIERMKEIKGLVDQYAARAKEIVAIKTEIVALQSKRSEGGAGAAETASRIAALDAQAVNIARERTLPLAAQMENESEKITANALKNMNHNVAEAARDMASSEFLGLGVGAIAIFLLIGSAVFGAVTIAKPLKALVKPLEDVAGGNFAIDVPGTHRKDEVGQIANAVAEMAAKVSSTIGEIKSSGREVTNASAEISTSTTDLSQRTEEQAASLEETSAAMEELSATVKKNAENAQQASQSASATRDVADRGGQVVAKAVEAMAKIEDSSRKISDIIGVIDEIARQTNLLALNAAVEAARAGEAGRGFAVVASEVRSLAQRSSQAAKDIKDLITNSNGQVKDGVELVSRAGASLTEIVESIKSVATIVADIANASIEQATGIEQINRALTQMDEVTQQNSALVEENAATAKTLEHQAKAMDEQVAFFQIAVGDDTYRAPRPMEPAAKIAVAPKTAPPKPATPKAAVKTEPASPVAKKPAPVAIQSEPAAARGPAAATASPARRMQTALATAVNADPDWKEF